MGLLILAGDRYNSAAYGTLTVSPAADVLYPSSKLIDQFIDEYWSQGSIAADSYIRCDLNQVTNGNLETFAASLFTGWASNVVGGSSTVTQELAIFKAGASSAKFTVDAAGGSKAEITQSLTVRSGQKWRGSFSMYAGAGGVTKAEIYNPYTHMYLNSSNAWQSAQAYHKTTVGTGAWEDFTTSFTIESWAACQSSLTALKLRFVDETVSTVGYVDEVYFWPEVNTVVLTAHNVESGLPIQWRSSTDNFAASDVLVTTLSARAGVTYSYQSSAVVTRYVALKFAGTPVAKLRATEAVWGYAIDTMRGSEEDLVHTSEIPQMRSSRSTIISQDFVNESLKLSIKTFLGDASFDEAKNEIFNRTDKGQLIIVIPHTDQSWIFIGRRSTMWSYTARTGFNLTELSIEPLPMGMFST